MKFIVLSLFLSAIISFQVEPDLIYIDLRTIDPQGNIAPNCKLEISASFMAGKRYGESDRLGRCFFPIPLVRGTGKNEIYVEIRKNHVLTYEKIEVFYWVNKGDTIRRKLTVYGSPDS